MAGMVADGQSVFAVMKQQGTTNIQQPQQPQPPKVVEREVYVDKEYSSMTVNELFDSLEQLKAELSKRRSDAEKLIKELDNFK